MYEQKQSTQENTWKRDVSIVTIFSSTTTRSFCLCISVNNTRSISSIVQACHLDIRIVIDKLFLDMTGRLGSQETAPGYDAASCV